MQAIQTEYNGYKFRSRLEARWAVFFDMLKVRYQYEPEGYVLEDGKKYLPDFYLNDFDTYVEIKSDPMMLTDYDKLKINGFAELAKRVSKGYVLLFDVPTYENIGNAARHLVRADSTRKLPDIYWSDKTFHADSCAFAPFSCPNCGMEYTHAYNVKTTWAGKLEYELKTQDKYIFEVQGKKIESSVYEIEIDYYCESHCLFTHIIHNRKGYQISSYKNRSLDEAPDFWQLMGEESRLRRALNVARKARFEFGEMIDETLTGRFSKYRAERRLTVNLAKPTT